MTILLALLGLAKPLLPFILAGAGVIIGVLGYGHKKKEEGRQEVIKKINDANVSLKGEIQHDIDETAKLPESELDAELTDTSRVSPGPTNIG